MIRVALLAALTVAIMASQLVSNKCLLCICKQETKCNIPSPLCKLDGASDACGPYQIHFQYWLDASETAGIPAPPGLGGGWMTCAETCGCSEQAVQYYMERYATVARLGRAPTCQDFARIHNGGPDGWKESGTLEYGEAVWKCFNGKGQRSGNSPQRDCHNSP